MFDVSLQSDRGRRGLAVDTEREPGSRRAVDGEQQFAELDVADAAGQSGRSSREDQADTGRGRDSERGIREAPRGARPGRSPAEDNGGRGTALGDVERQRRWPDARVIRQRRGSRGREEAGTSGGRSDSDIGVAEAGDRQPSSIAIEV